MLAAVCLGGDDSGDDWLAEGGAARPSAARPDARRPGKRRGGPHSRPDGSHAAVAGGHLDGALLASRVADHLAIWEHKLDSVLCLDPAAEAELRLTLERYPPTQRVDAQVDMRIDLGGGAAVDVYGQDRRQGGGSVANADGQDGGAAGSPSEAGVSVSFGRVWVPLVGRPPAPASGAPEQALRVDEPASDLVSDGEAFWADDSYAQTAQPL